MTLPSFTNAGWFEIDDTSHVTVNGTYTQTDGTTSLAGGTLTSKTPLIDIEGGTVTGTGTLDGDVVNASNVVVGVPGTPGVLVVTGNYTQTASGDLYLEIGGTGAGTDFGQLRVGKTASLDGTLSIVLINGYTPPSGATFRVMTYASATGTFATLDHDGSSFTPEYNLTDLTLLAN